MLALLYNHLKYTLQLFAVLGAAPSGLGAALSWETQAIQHTAQPSDTASLGVFKFRNTGKEAVTINSTNSSCGCTVAQLAKKEYAPGESGEIKLTFHFGSRTGQQQQSVQVRTSDPASDATLKLSVTIPKFATLTPTLVFWRQGEALDAKTLSLKLEAPAGANILSATSSDPKFQVAMTTVVEGHEYQIRVTPVLAEANQQGPFLAKSIITIQTDLPASSKSTLHAYAFIKR